MNNEIERIAQHNDMSVEFVTWFFNEKKSACGEHWFLVLGAMWEGWKGRSIEMDRLAAENVGLKDLARGWANATDDRLFEEFGEIFHDSIDDCEADLKIICPATDRIVAGIKADGVEEFAAYCGEENSVFVEAKAYYRSLPDAAYEFSSMLREGADK